MKTTKIEHLKISLKGENQKHFTSALKKLAKAGNVGFKQFNFTEDETKVITELSDKINN